MSRNYISCADTAKLVRAALKESFPDVKFGVRSSVYAGGASITVRWTDGPNAAQVQSVAQTFEGSYFDGSIDYKGSRYNMVDGIETRFGANFIFCERDHSDALIARAIAGLTAIYLDNIKESLSDGTAVIPTVEDYRKGRTYYLQIPGLMSWGDAINRRLSKISDRLTFPASKTAGKVIHLGNDGCSPIGALAA